MALSLLGAPGAQDVRKHYLKLSVQLAAKLNEQLNPLE